MGDLQHEFNISEEAAVPFNKGLLLLHSFEYEDARESFQEAIKADPGEMMAYWGETMSYYKALWGLQDIEAGREVMNKLGKTKEERLEKADNELEKDFWLGIEILYGEGELADRNKAYAKHMEALYQKHPGNQEVAAFYALGLMWSVPLGRDEEVFNKSAKVAEGILEENPNHPGAIHYIIHAYDDPKYAQFATEAANKYAKTAPDAAHALHMPSHIYLAMGMWNDVVSSNEASYAASVKRMELKGLDDKARGYHSYSWLHYGYLQQGRYEDARKLLDDMMTYTERSPSNGARSYLISMQNMQLIATGKWAQKAAPMFVDYEDLALTTKAQQNFFKSMLAFQQNDVAAIREEIKKTETLYDVAKLEVSAGGIARCSAGPTRYAPNKESLNRANIIIHQMKAMAALLEKDNKNAETNFQKAAELETNSEYSYGPPDIPYPSFELYANWLMENERYEEAIVQYDLSLKRAPGRAMALNGKMNALKKLGKTEEAKETQKDLNAFWKGEQIASI